MEVFKRREEHHQVPPQLMMGASVEADGCPFPTVEIWTKANVDVGTGAQQGTKGYNTPPEISSALTASVTYSNINYQKRSATKYDDLVLWYTFDESDGSTAVDYSSNERNATLKNMSASNRVAGKMGGALSFDTPSA